MTYEEKKRSELNEKKKMHGNDRTASYKRFGEDLLILSFWGRSDNDQDACVTQSTTVNRVFLRVEESGNSGNSSEVFIDVSATQQYVLDLDISFIPEGKNYFVYVDTYAFAKMEAGSGCTGSEFVEARTVITNRDLIIRTAAPE